MLSVRKTYHLLCFNHIRQGLGILFSAAGEASQRRGHTVRSFSFFLGRLGRHAAPKGKPKGRFPAEIKFRYPISDFLFPISDFLFPTEIKI